MELLLLVAYHEYSYTFGAGVVSNIFKKSEKDSAMKYVFNSSVDSLKKNAWS